MPTPFFRHLTDDGLPGDGTNNEANVNGVITPVPFYAGPTVGKRWTVSRLIIMVEDNAIFTPETYGGVGTLANGVEIALWQDGVAGTRKHDLLDGDPVNGIAHYSELCYDVSYQDFGSGNNFATARWTFTASGGALLLDNKDGEIFVVTINDDLTALVKHNFMIQGLEWGPGEYIQ